MSKYKIHIDPTLPDSKKIQGHKDFDALYDHYQVNTRLNFWRNLYRKPTNFAILVLVLAVGALVFDSVNEEEVAKTDFFLKAPSQGLMPEAKSLTWEPEAEVELAGSAWTLSLPEGAFMDSSGKEVLGKVNLFYRWMPAARDWLKRGLPLQDSQTAFASRGILELFAYQGKVPVQLMPGKPLVLTVPFGGAENRYLPMQLDTLTRNWEYIKDTSWTRIWEETDLSAQEKKPVFDSTGLDLVAKAAAKRLRKPARPFGVEVENKNQYPYFRNYEKVYWEYLDLPGSANPWAEDLLGKENGWNKVRIRQTGDKQFTITFSKVLPNGSVIRKRVIAKPLFKASTKAEAEAIYQDRLKAYEDALGQIEKDRANALATREKEYLQSLSRWESEQAGSPQLLGKQLPNHPETTGFCRHNEGSRDRQHT